MRLFCQLNERPWLWSDLGTARLERQTRGGNNSKCLLWSFFLFCYSLTAWASAVFVTDENRCSGLGSLKFPLPPQATPWSGGKGRQQKVFSADADDEVSDSRMWPPIFANYELNKVLNSACFCFHLHIAVPWKIRRGEKNDIIFTEIKRVV